MHLLAVFSLRNRALIALVSVVIAIFGGIALTSLKQELIPSVSFPQLVIVTSYPGAAPEVVNEEVSTPIETAVQAVPGIVGTTANSSTNVSTVSVEFEYGTEIARAEQRVQLAVNRIESRLPADVDPQILTGSLDDLPVIQVAVTSDLDPRDLSEALERSALPDLRALDNVREVSVLGETGRRVTITPDTGELVARGLSQRAILDALDDNGVLIPAGEVTEGDDTLSVQAGSRLGSTDDLAALPLLDGNRATLLGDVATVALADDPVTGISRVNGEPALTLAITKTPDGNTVDVSREVRAMLPDLEDAIGSGTRLIVVFDQAPFIEESIESLATEGALGLLFAVIVILVFLLSIRATLVTAISIPLSLLITFIGLLASEYTLNILTLGALTISVGRVVDDSIVVIENIKRHLELGEDKLAAIRTAVREVAVAITSATVTTVAVFLPLALVGDITGELFRPFALTVTIALGASLFVSLTIVPVLAYWFLGRDRHPHTAIRRTSDDDRATRLQRGYLPILDFTLKRPLVTVLLSLLILVGTGALVPLMKTNFIGDSGQNTVTVTQQLPAGTSLDARSEAAAQVEDVLLGIDGIETVQLSVGTGGSFTRAFFGRTDTTFSITTADDADQEVLRADVRDEIDALSDDAGELTLAAAGSGFASSDIEVDISANGQQDLETAADDVLAAVRDLDVTAEATSDLAERQPYLAIEVDREEAAQAGLSELAVGGILAQSTLPASVGSVVIDESTLGIYIADPDAPDSIEEFRDFPIPTPSGLVPLDSLATVEEVEGPVSITTVRGVRAATVSITPNSDDVGRASAAVQEAVDAVELPAGADAELSGVTAEQSDAFAQLGLALLAAILIVYTVMVATFKSLRQPLLLLVSIPFAATGAILLQIVSDIPLGVPSLIGVLMLIGIVVTNAIVLVDLVNQYRERGSRVYDAIVRGASRRLRPILMTALATIFALLPLALGITGQGGFISQPLAIVVIGGLLSSTLLTLVVLPALYYLVEGWRERRSERSLAKQSDRGSLM
ncbi:efflux RND transporter permease subunit [Lysobacter korlensis]|uniref:Efflux RND transporter permease subunit n=1 Tax=Lysobacter korlensis TaxID=553636 RepID=A0ABV6RU17_9GAMM